MIKLVEELTGKEWHFDVTMPEPVGEGPANLPVFPPTVFGFVGQPWSPGFYVLSNSSGADVDIILFGQSFTVPDQTKWRFMAHNNLESAQLLWAATGAVGKQFPYGGANVPSTGT